MSDDEVPPSASPEGPERAEVVQMSDQQIAALGAHIQSIAQGILVTIPGHFEAFAAYLEARERRLMFADVKRYAKESPAIRRSIKICHALSQTRVALATIMEAPQIIAPGYAPPPGGNDGQPS